MAGYRLWCSCSTGTATQWRASGCFLQLTACVEHEPRVKGELSGYAAYPDRSHPVGAQTKITLT